MLQRTQSLWFAILLHSKKSSAAFRTFFRRKPQAKLRGRDTNPHLLLAKAYTLTVLSDIGAFPRPGANGRLTARQGLCATRVQWCYNKSRSVSLPSQYIDVKLALTVGQQPICFIIFSFQAYLSSDDMMILPQCESRNFTFKSKGHSSIADTCPNSSTIEEGWSDQPPVPASFEISIFMSKLLTFGSW